MENTLQEDLAAVARIDVVQKILDVVCRSTGMGFAAVARVTDERWLACAVRDGAGLGLIKGSELPLETTLCNQIRRTGELVAFDQASSDDIYRDHPTPKIYGFESYLAVPIRLESGEFFGTLCALDRKPTTVNRPEVIETFRLFADLIAMHLDAFRRYKAHETALAQAEETAQFRDQFMAVLGHDLRNPLGAIRGAAELLQMTPRDQADTEMLELIQRSVSRMTGLIDNVLDFARGRLGGGLHISCDKPVHAEICLKQVVAELRTAWSARTLVDDIDLDRPVRCDAARLGQMMSNLIANALVHGDPGGPVRVIARTENEELTISVINHGRPIPPATIERLFQPFVRGIDKAGNQTGLGLGLFIASEIAKAHNGRLTVVSGDVETRFTFSMPI